MSALDRDAAREVLDRYGVTHPLNYAPLLANLESCVRPGPPHTIDREALFRLRELIASAPWGDWIDEKYGSTRDRLVPAVEIAPLLNRLKRPVEGVVLTREEARVALSWLSTRPVEQFGDADQAVRDRLEGAS